MAAHYQPCIHTQLIFLLCSYFTIIMCFCNATPPLETYNVDKGKISLSGFSSGGSFAVQFHIAFSANIMGAGIAAGAPYWCSKGNWTIAQEQCMHTAGNANVSDYTDKVMKAFAAGKIDSPSNLPTDWVYVFSTGNDTVMSPAVLMNTYEFYRMFVAKGFILDDFDTPGEHAMITDNFGNPCQLLHPPYISNCGYSVAERFIEVIYNVNPSPTRKKWTPILSNNLFEFSQSEFIESDKTSMDSIGYIYVPSNCQNKTKTCKLHLVFHGCEQGRDKVGDLFPIHAEYNLISEENDIIVLYPQIKSDPHDNPHGCWDWVGSTNSDYLYKDGLQMATVKRMMDRVAGL